MDGLMDEWIDGSMWDGYDGCISVGWKLNVSCIVGCIAYESH